MVIMFNPDSFINDPKCSELNNVERECVANETSPFTLEELYRFRHLFWSNFPKLYERLLFKLSEKVALKPLSLEFVPPILLPEGDIMFEEFSIDLKSNEQLMVGANLYRGNWDCPLVCITGCNYKTILVLNKYDMNKIQEFMRLYNIKANAIG